MSEVQEVPSDDLSDSTTCYHCKCANAAVRTDISRQTVNPEICYAEQSVEDHSLNDSGSHRLASTIVWRNLSPPQHVGGSEMAPRVTARHLDIMRAKLAGRFDRSKNAGCKKTYGGVDE